VNFNGQAVVWDNDPKKIERANIVDNEIKSFIQLNQRLGALKFGCGTGLLSSELKDSFNNTLMTLHQVLMKIYMKTETLIYKYRKNTKFAFANASYQLKWI